MRENSILTTENTWEDEIDANSSQLGNQLRPHSLSEYIGQAKLKEKLSVFIEAAKQRSESLDHLLLYGPPGLGKTSLAHIIAHEMNSQLKTSSGPAIEKAGDLAALLTNLEENDVLFIDEIHRLSHVVEEILYPAMEDFQLDIVIGQGPSARSIKLDLPKFTLVGATTRAGLLTSPLRDRFGYAARLEFYNESELSLIVLRSANLLQVPIDENAAAEIARRSRGTPRIVNRLLKRVRDFAQVRGNGKIDLEIAQASLQLLEVDQMGLDTMDRRILEYIIKKFDGGPVGIESLAAALGEESHTIEDVYEPYLVQVGFIQRSNRGRIASREARQHLGLA